MQGQNKMVLGRRPCQLDVQCVETLGYARSRVPVRAIVGQWTRGFSPKNENDVSTTRDGIYYFPAYLEKPAAAGALDRRVVMTFLLTLVGEKRNGQVNVDFVPYPALVDADRCTHERMAVSL